MNLNKESLIEAFIRDIDSLTPKQQAQAEQMIDRDPEARELSDFLRAFYAEYETQSAGSTDLTKIADALFFSPRVVRLRPKKTQPIDSETGLPHPVVLSAATVSRATGYSYVGSVIADDGYVIIRFLLDQTSDRVRGFILSEDSKYLRQTVLSITDSGPHFLSGPNGRIDFSFDSSKVLPLLQHNLYLRRSIGDLKLDPATALTQTFTSFEIDVDTQVFIRLLGATIEIKSPAVSRPLFTTLFPTAPGEQIVHPIGPETTAIRLANGTNLVNLRFFG